MKAAHCTRFLARAVAELWPRSTDVIARRLGVPEYRIWNVLDRAKVVRAQSREEAQ